jgi:two-component system chemotaxis response regulator CheB
VAGRDIVTIGASAGGVEALCKLMGGLPADLPAAIFVVVHISPDAPSALPAILGRAGPLRAAHAVNGAYIERSHIYIAPPDHHLLLKDHGRMAVVRGPKENRFRPAIDSLFRTAARTYGPRVVGVILSGAGDDGVAGLAAIKTRGGTTVVQDPADALLAELPRSAIEMVNVDHCRSSAEVASLLTSLVQTPAPEMPRRASDELDKEAQLAEADLSTIEDEDKPGLPSTFSCPDCGGVLWELEGDDLLRFRCRVGHSYSALSLVDEQAASSEKGLWAAFRALEENSSFARRLAVRARRAGHLTAAERYLERAEEASQNACVIRGMIVRLHAPQAIKPSDN